MFDDNLWNDTDVQGFRFDWDDSDPVLGDTASATDWNYVEQINLVDQEAIASEIEKQICDVCHQVITSPILYEKNAAFCSEECWKRVLHTALDDFAVGGISAWPLDTFCSFKAKAFLLELASESFDGNMIVKILCSFQTTIAPDLFKHLVLEHPVAFNHFTNFLRKTQQKEILQEFLTSRGSVELSKIQAFTELTQELDTTNSSNVEHLIHRLRIFAMTELSSEPKLARIHEASMQLADLLEFQFLYQDAWHSFCNGLPNSDVSGSSFLALSLAETIRACCEMDKTVSLGSRAHQLRLQHKICDEQFRWLVIEPLAHCENWAELEGLLLEKKWLKRRVDTTLPNDRLVMYLHALNAPEDVVSSYLERANDTDELLEIAMRLRMYKVAVTYCAKRRDTAGMKELLSRIPKKESEYAKVLYYLSLPVNQWKEDKTEL